MVLILSFCAKVYVFFVYVCVSVYMCVYVLQLRVCLKNEYLCVCTCVYTCGYVEMLNRVYQEFNHISG